jgi:hypothetical protein
MKLSLLVNCGSVMYIQEGYGRVLDIDYTNTNVDPKPKVFLLGRWRHPSTNNQLVAGINLNYLSKTQLDKLRYYAPEILKNKDLYTRYWVGRRLVPDVFETFYRTYRKDRITSVNLATLRYMTPRELEKTGDTEKAARLQKRRDQLKDLRVKKRGRIRPALRPTIEPDIPPEVEPEAPEVEPDILEKPQTVTDKAKDAVDANRAKKMVAKIDDRTREMIAKTKEEPELEEPELEEPELEEPELEEPELEEPELEPRTR